MLTLPNLIFSNQTWNSPELLDSLPLNHWFWYFIGRFFKDTKELKLTLFLDKQSPGLSVSPVEVGNILQSNLCSRG